MKVINKVCSAGAAMALLASCGGGGGGAGNSPSSTPATTAWVAGQFAPASTFAAMCASPRTGTDPTTQKPYPDKQGIALDEKNWLRSWNNDLYLWFGEVLDQDPAAFASDAAFFAVLKSTVTTASGAPKDKFHFTYPTATWEALSQSGVEAGYGANFVIIAARPPRNVVVSYTEPGSQAASSPGGLVRGDKILTVDGVDLVNASDQASIDTLNAGLSPKTVGETHSLGVLDPNATSSRTVTFVSANIATTPVQNVKTLPTAAGTLVGYMLFNDHLATAERALVNAFTQLQSAGVRDLVLDIRYNGGGYLAIASEVAYMIAGPGVTAGQTFELTRFNSKHPTVDPVNGQTITPLGFLNTTQGFSTTSGQALPTLSLPRVFVLTSASTCSASETIINSLQGVNVQVIQVGTTTCGKPYGFYPQDNCAVTYFSIQFQGVNAKQFGNYADGFTPANTVAVQGVHVPGCSVTDDFAHALGDPSEAVLASALSYQATGVCPLPPSSMAPPSPLAAAAYVPPSADGKSIKSVWQQNRLYGMPAR